MSKPSEQNELAHLFLSLAVLLALVGLGVYGYVYNKLGEYKQQVSQWIHFALFFQLLPLLLLWWSGKILIHWYHRWRAGRDVRFVQIIPYRSKSVDVYEIMSFVNSFGGMYRGWLKKIFLGSPWFRFRVIQNEDRQILIYLGFPQDKESDVRDTIKSTYPQAEIREVSRQEFPQPLEGGTGGHFVFKWRKKGLPLASFAEKKRSEVGNIWTRLRPNTMIDIQFSPAKWKEYKERSEEVIEELKEKKDKDLDPHEKAHKTDLAKRNTGREVIFKVVVSIWSNYRQNEKDGEQENDSIAGATVRSLANKIQSVMKHNGEIRFIRHDWWCHLKTINPMPLPLPFLKMVWTSEELANLIHFPPAEHFIYDKPRDDQHGRLVHLKKGQVLLSEEECRGTFILGKLDHPLVVDRLVAIVDDVFRRHVGIFGKTGSGKSAFVMMIVKGIIEIWLDTENKLASGFTVFDPKEDTVLTILTFLKRMDKKLKEKNLPGIDWSKVHYFDLGSKTHPIGLNLLHRYPGESDSDVANRALSILKNAYPDNQSVMLLEKYGMLGLRLLLADDQEHSFLALETVLRDIRLRHRLAKKIKDPLLKYDYEQLRGKLDQGNEVEPLINRMQKFRNDDILRRIFGQTKMSIDFKKVMDNGEIVLYNAKKLNDEQMRLIGGFIVTQMYEVSKRREDESVLHPFIAEEVQLYQIRAMEKILALSRSAGLVFVPVTQVLHKLEKWLYEAIKENINTVIACEQGPDSARKIVELTNEKFSASDLQQLDSLVGAVQTKNRHGENVYYFLKADPPYIYGEDGEPTYYGEDRSRTNREKRQAFQYVQNFAEKHLQQRDCLSAEEIDEMIKKYYLMDEQPEPGDDNITDDSKVNNHQDNAELQQPVTVPSEDEDDGPPIL